MKCYFKNVTNEDKVKFKDSSCLLTISVGQETHEDKRLIATIDLISTSFKSFTIALHDTLQRHTISINNQENEKNAYDIALALGDKWIERNKKHYNKLTNYFNIKRWDEWLSSDQFYDKKKLILSEINCDEKYRAFFYKSINEYLTRYSQRLKNPYGFDRKHAEKLCFDYLVEECAVLCLWPNTGCQFEVYAGTHNDAMNETRKKFVRQEFSDFVHPISIGFNHRPDLSPQNFKLFESEQTVNLTEHSEV